MELKNNNIKYFGDRDLREGGMFIDELDGTILSIEPYSDAEDKFLVSEYVYDKDNISADECFRDSNFEQCAEPETMSGAQVARIFANTTEDDLYRYCYETRVIIENFIENAKIDFTIEVNNEKRDFKISLSDVEKISDILFYSDSDNDEPFNAIDADEKFTITEMLLTRVKNVNIEYKNK